MALTLTDMTDGLRKSRRFFLRHISGLRDDQWDWKPYAECKSIRESLAHLVVDDRAALESLRTGAEPDYDGISKAVQEEIASNPVGARALLDASHAALLDHVTTRYGSEPLDAEVCVWGGMSKLAPGIAYLSSEDFYHAGQVAFIRIATDPAWDYYGQVYGVE